MSSFTILTSDGGLTACGYVLCAAGIPALLLGAGTMSGSRRHRLSVRQLVFCGTAMALSFVTSCIKVFSLPYGGSVTLFSMLFICLTGYWYGLGTGMLTGLAYGILQFLQEPYVLSPFQVCCDYILAFAGLGLAGAFTRQTDGLRKGYLLGITVRGAFHALGGYLYWMDYMPENFPQSISRLYPIVYNYSFILAEGVLTLAVVSLPPVRNALGQIRRLAAE